MVKNK